MNKSKRLAAAFAALLACALMLTACNTTAALDSQSSSTSSTSSESSASSEESSAPSEESSASSEESGLGLYNNIEDYLADPAVKAQMDASMDSMQTSDMSIVVTGEGNALVYTFTYGVQLDLSDEATKESVVSALEEGMAQQADVYTGIADSLRPLVTAKDVSVRIIYNNADGSEIYSCEFE